MWEFLDWRTHHVMTTEVVSLRAEASLESADQLFSKHAISALPVVDPRGELLGLVTPLDLLSAFRFDATSTAPDYARVLTTPVREVMTRAVSTVNPMTPLTRVLERLVRHRVRSLPVVEHHKLVGMISRRDVLVGLRAAAEGEGPPDPAPDPEPTQQPRSHT